MLQVFNLSFRRINETFAMSSIFLITYVHIILQNFFYYFKIVIVFR